MKPLLLGLLGFVLVTTSLMAAAKIEKTEYKGHEGYRLSSGEVEMILLTDVGPRVIRYAFVGGRNILKEMSAAEEASMTAGQDWKLYGGHRIWVGPELPSYTYAADNEPTKVVVKGDSVRSTQPVDSAGIEKEIEVRMNDSGGVELIHRLTNRSKWPLDYAAWALTMMAPGGRAIATFPPRGTHPENLDPASPLVTWRFTNLSDPRWTLLEKYLVLHGDPNVSDPEKLGLFNENTRGAYLLGSDLFVKRYQADATAKYPDMGVSFETFTNGAFLELETLGPMRSVKPGETLEHIENWSLHKNVSVSEWTDKELDRKIAPLLR